MGKHTGWVLNECRKGQPSGAFNFSPGFDDYLLGYKDRSASLDPGHARRLANGGILKPSMVMNGKVIGTWSRTHGRDGAAVKTETFTALGKKGRSLVEAAVNAYSHF